MKHTLLVALTSILILVIVIPMLLICVQSYSAGTKQGAIDYLWNQYSLVVYGAGTEYSDNFVPSANNTYNLGSLTKQWKSLTVASLTDSGLTSGRVPIAGTGGLVSDSSNLTFDTTTGTLASLTADTLSVGSTTGEVSNIYIGDAGKLHFGLAQEDTIEHDGSQSLAFNLGAPLNALKEVVFYSNITHSTNVTPVSQAPIWTINQLGTGEAAWRIIHSDDTVNWCMGQLGRAPGGAGKLAADTVHRDLYLWLDTQTPVFSAKYATDTTAGRMLLGNWWWSDTGSAGARLEIRGSSDEPQLLVKGFPPQTNYVADFQSSSNVSLLTITDSSVIFKAGFATNYITYNSAGNIPTIAVTGAYLRIGNTSDYGGSVGAGDVLFTGQVQILGNTYFDSVPKFSNNSTSSKTSSLGANCPAVDNSTPYTWITVKSGDGSTVYIPAWK